VGAFGPLPASRRWGHCHRHDYQPVADLLTQTVYLEAETTIGDTVELTVLRDGTPLNLPVTVGEESTDLERLCRGTRVLRHAA
jgi:S1-C subfamily serine protease